MLLFKTNSALRLKFVTTLQIYNVISIVIITFVVDQIACYTDVLDWFFHQCAGAQTVGLHIIEIRALDAGVGINTVFSHIDVVEIVTGKFI